MVLTIGPWAVGLVVRSRRRLTEQLAARGRELAAERALFAAEAVRYERARIARELHDIVAHCVSVMVIQASAGQRLTATDPALAAEAFDSIAEAARQAEAEIGRLVELLDHDSQQRGVRWRPADRRARHPGGRGRAGRQLPVHRLSGRPCGPAADAAYRVVQESLTNALKHAPGAPVDVVIAGAGGHVEIGVRQRARDRPAVRTGAHRRRPRAGRDAGARDRLRRRDQRRPGGRRRLAGTRPAAPPARPDTSRAA